MKRTPSVVFAAALLAAAGLAALAQSLPSTPGTAVAGANGAILMLGNTAPVAKVEVPAAIKGILKSVDVIQGQKVKKGDPLAQLDNAMQELQVESAKQEEDDGELKIKEAQNNLDYAKTDLDRVKAGGGSEAEKRQKELMVVQYQIEVQRAQNNQKSQQTSLQKEQLTLERMTIHSPIDGAVLRVNKQAGEETDDNPLIVVVQVDKLYAIFYPRAELFGKIKVGDKVMLDFATDPVIHREAVVSAVDPIIEQSIFQVKLTVDNADSKIPAGTSATWTWKDKAKE